MWDAVEGAHPLVNRIQHSTLHHTLSPYTLIRRLRKPAIFYIMRLVILCADLSDIGIMSLRYLFRHSVSNRPDYGFELSAAM